ncbi:MAG TPA: S-layer homology domain-containing protein [Anaerolineales bacterium]
MKTAKRNLYSAAIIFAFLASIFSVNGVTGAAPAALPPGIPLLPASLVRSFATSNAAWNPSAPDPAGVDYWPKTGGLLIADSEVDEMPAYFTGKNVFLATRSGTLTGTCSTMSFTDEPAGLAVNPNNNHIFFSSDESNLVTEVSLGPDGAYCTSDDQVRTRNVSSLYGITDPEDVAYGNNTLFIAGGEAAEVYVVPLGADGMLDGGDDGPMTHFDTAGWGFSDVEGIGYNAEAGTLFITSFYPNEDYLGEATPTGTLLRAYDLSFMGALFNIRSDVAYAPSSQNPAVRSIYIASRGQDNNIDPNENDGRIWEIRISVPALFADVPAGYWAKDFVERLYRAGITGGCTSNPLNYCPEETVTRAQMAVFLLRGIHGSNYNPPAVGGSTGFSDVPTTHWAAAWIKQLTAESITSGCGVNSYCPDAPVTRAQMAVFLLRSKHGASYNPPAVGNSTGFSDVPATHWAAAWIKQLVAEGIATGCMTGSYCPEAPVTRAQMAVFLVRTFNLP